MTVHEFADQYQLTIARDLCGDSIIPGRLGKDSNISDFSDTELAMCWLTDGKKTARTGLWTRTKAACIAAGMTLHQDGDAEGILTFDPDIPGQAKLAIKCVQAKAKRQMTPERIAALSETLALKLGKPVRNVCFRP
jgi:hypothetical protein